MADRQPTSAANTQRAPRPTTEAATATTATLIRRLQEHAPHSPQLFGLLTLFISGAILLSLTGLTLTATVMGLLFAAPLILLTSPIWVPVGFFLVIAAAGVLSLFGFAAAAAFGFSWVYRYYKGMQPPGSNRMDYARSRIYDTASHVRDYAREYGGYLQSKVKDAAPGA